MFTAAMTTLLASYTAGEDPLWPGFSNTLVALWVGNPGPLLLDGAEVSGGGYTRVTTVSTDWYISINNLYNSIVHAFPEATANWGVVTHVVLIRADNIPIVYGALNSPKEIVTGSIARFDIAALVVAFT